MYITVWLAILVCVVIYLYIFRKRKRYNLPSGPKGYPLIGNSLQVTEKNLHLKITEWAKQYGEIYTLSLFGDTVVVINSADIAREALLKEPNATIFSSRLPTFAGKHVFFNYSDLALSGYDEIWIKRKKLCYRLLKAYSAGVKTIEDHIQNDLNETIIRIKADNGTAVDLDDIVTDSLYGLITILITGRRYGPGSDIIRLMRKYDLLSAEMTHPGTNFLLKWFPFLTVLPGPISKLYSECKEAQRKFRALIMKEKDNVDKYEGMVHQLFKEQMLNSERTNTVWPTDDEILALLTDLELGGILTSKGLLLSLIWTLSFHPEIQTKMQKEVDKITGLTRKPRMQDRQNMPYTEAVIMEGLRIFSQLPLLIPHGTSDDSKLAGYTIPKGTTIFVNSWHIHHDEEVFEKSWEFMPERFLNAEGNLLDKDSPQRISYMPFGIGKRSCIGEAFGKKKNFLFMAVMMQNFTFYPDTQNQPKFDPRDLDSKLIMMPNRFKCRAVERKNFYEFKE